MPPILAKLARRLADQLAVMDGIAQDIREELSKQVEPSASIDEKARITKQSLALIYYELFNEKPEEFYLQRALEDLKEMGISTTKDFRNHLPNGEVKQKLDKLHRKYFGGWNINNIDLLIWGTKVMLLGNKVYREFVQKTKIEWNEIVATARGDILSELPDTIEELVECLESGKIERGFFDAIKELGGAKECGLCGTAILDPYSAHEVLCEHYDVDMPELSDLLQQLYADGSCDGVEWGDECHSGLCAHCAHLIHGKNT